MIKIAFDPVYAHALPENHRFPMLKYEPRVFTFSIHGLTNYPFHKEKSDFAFYLAGVDILSTDKFGKLRSL
jgi:acetoin utilization deacetylase AcuC-like enzyme